MSLRAVGTPTRATTRVVHGRDVILGNIRQILPRHHAEGNTGEYMQTAGLAGEPAHAPLFRTAKGKTKELTDNGMKGKDVLRMVKRRFKAAGLPANLACHRLRATTITDLLDSGVIGAPDGTVLLTPNEHRVAEDHRDCYWLYVVTDCNAEPKLRTIKDPVSYDWRPMQKVQHYTISARA